MTGEEQQGWRRTKLRRRALERRAKEEVCAECGGVLAVRCRNASGEPVLVCSTDSNHKGTKKEIWKHQGHGEFRKEGETVQTTTLVTMTEQQMMNRINNAKFPRDLTAEQKKVLANVANEYGLDPLMGEIMPYQGRPFVCISGRRRKAQESGELDGMDDTRPANREEREAWGIADGDYFFRAAIYKKDCRMPFVGWGKVTQKEINKMRTSAQENKKDPEAIPVVKDPAAMAAKRAEAQALMKGWHIPLPSYEDIVDGEFAAIDDNSDEQTTLPPSSASRGHMEGIKPKNLGELFSLCSQHFRMNQASVLQELGVSSKLDIGDVTEAWLQIIDIRRPSATNSKTDESVVDDEDHFE